MVREKNARRVCATDNANHGDFIFVGEIMPLWVASAATRCRCSRGTLCASVVFGATDSPSSTPLVVVLALCSLLSCVSRIGFSCNGPHTLNVLVLTEREAPSLIQILTHKLQSLEVGHPTTLQAGSLVNPSRSGELASRCVQSRSLRL